MLDLVRIAKPFEEETRVGFTNPFDVIPLIKEDYIILFKPFVEEFHLSRPPLPVDLSSLL